MSRIWTTGKYVKEETNFVYKSKQFHSIPGRYTGGVGRGERVPAAEVQRADSPLFEHAGLAFLSFPLPVLLPLFLPNWPHASTFQRARELARVYARTPRVTARDLCVLMGVCVPAHTRGVHTRCQRYFSIWKASSNDRRVSPRLFLCSKENLNPRHMDDTDDSMRCTVTGSFPPSIEMFYLMFTGQPDRQIFHLFFNPFISNDT